MGSFGRSSFPIVRRGLSMVGGASFANSIDARAQIICERLSVFDRRKRGEGDRRADPNRQRRANASFDFMEDERKPDGLTHMARNLEQTAVLAAKPDRHDRRLRTLDEL